MTNFRTYGAAAILVSAGIMITGVLWFDRPAPYVSGEDLAELTAAVNERLAIGYLTGTNSPTYPSNAILPWIEWRGLYDSVLVRARAIATNAPAELPAVWFLDASEPLPASGDLLVSNGCFWAITAVQTNKHPEGAQTNYTWRLFSDTNHSDAIPATSTRRSFGPPYITFPPAASNSYPFSEFFYPEMNAVRGFSGSWKNGNWWTGIGMGTNVYKWGCENWSTNFYVTTGKWITINNLNEARNVLMNLTRTIYVCPSSALAYTNCTETWTSTNINWSVATNCPAVLPWDPYEQFAGLVFTAVPATAYRDSVWNGRLGSYRAKLYRWDLGGWWGGNGWFGDGPGWAYHWYADFNATLRSKYLTGCSLPYPSDYAIANGLVSRVTVYAVAYNEASAHDNLTYPLYVNYYIGIDETLTWFELDGSNPEPNDWDGINLGFIDKVAELPSVPTNVNVCSKYIYDGFAGMPIDAAGLPIAGARLSLVGTFAAGAGCKDFAFGTQALVPPDPAPDYRYSHTGIETYSTLREAPDTLDEQWAVEFDRNIVVTHFVVIVDWNWTHCNPSRPFVPTPHTPEWASTNAP